MYVASTLIPGLAPIAYAWSALRVRLATEKNREAGYTTETIIVTALLVIVALMAIGILYTQVKTGASKISTDPSGTNFPNG
jgi:uncharacterized membrane protein